MVYGVERTKGSQLRDMFLPKLSPEGQKALRDHPNFVRSQLKHYGVEFEESKFVGKGTTLLKRALQEGKCDEVPKDIAKLEKQMHSESRSQKPKTNRLTNIVKEDSGSSIRRKMHMDYLQSRSKNKSEITPVGSYAVECETIARNWSAHANGMRLQIHQTDTPGVFQANFHFGIFKGVMFLSSDAPTLEKYCTQADKKSNRGNPLDDENIYSTDDSDSDDNHSVPAQGNPGRGVKRPLANSNSKKGAKKSKTAKKQPTEYLLQLKCRSTSDGEIDCDPQEGTIEFDDERLVSFDGKVTMAHGVGEASFFARKISDEPEPSREDWSNYSRRAYEEEQASRWR